MAKKPKNQPATNQALNKDAGQRMREQLTMLKQFTTNAVTSRAVLSQWLLDQLHDIDKECGYPTTISAEQYKHMYERDGIGKRVVSIYPTESWAVEPEIFESQTEGEETPFEADLEAIINKHSLYEKWHRLDELSGIGHYGVMLVGFDDGLPLDQPVAGVEEKLKEMFFKTTKQKPDKSNKKLPKPSTTEATEATDGTEKVETVSKTQQITNALEKTSAVKQSVEAETLTDDPEQEESKSTVKTSRNVLYFTPLDETQAQISSIDQNPNSWRLGRPIYYNISFFSPDDYTGVFATPAQSQTRVHWTRVIHVPDNCKSHEVYGQPRMKPVYNYLLNIRKVLGGSAESMWKSGFPGYAFEVPAEINDQVELDTEALSKEVDLFMNTLKKYMALQGVTAKVLQGQIADPQSQVDVQILAICIAIEAPKRVFMGSEEAKLASIEDSTAWLNRVATRQKKQLTPRVVRPTIDLLIAAEAVSAPSEYFVDWPDLHTMSNADKASVAAQLTQALVQYIAGGGDSMIPPLEFLVNVFQWDRDLAIAVLQAAEERLLESEVDREAEVEEQKALSDEEKSQQLELQKQLTEGLAEGAKEGGVHIPQQSLPLTKQPPPFGGRPRASNLPIPNNNEFAVNGHANQHLELLADMAVQSVITNVLAPAEIQTQLVADAELPSSTIDPYLKILSDIAIQNVMSTNTP